MDEDTDFELMELQDQVETVGFLTPREYGKLRNMAPQLVYYYIRQKVIEIEYCKCGRKVLDVAKVDEILAGRKKKES